MKIIIVPDSFKGGAEAKKVCEICESVLRREIPDAETECIPGFDGGEGSVENYLEISAGKAVGGKIQDGNFFIRNGIYAVSNEEAFIAISNSSGLAKTMIKDPAFTTSYGFGQQISQAIKLGKKRIILALGGSSTNDGGAGAAVALGAKFYNGKGEEFIPTGGTLKEIVKVDTEVLKEKIKGIEFIGLCDVENPLTGEDGCSYTYGGQKGAKSKERRDELEENMKYYAEATSFSGVSPKERMTGAAGGLGYFIKAFLKGKLVSGAEWFFEKVKFKEKAKDADYIISGEGKFDETSLRGKICGKVIEYAKESDKKVIILCGEKEKGFFIEDKNIKIYEINEKDKSKEENIRESENNLRKAIEEVAKEIKKI